MKRSKLMLIGIILVILIGLSLIMLVRAADNQQALQDELNNLTSQLNDGGYGWLIDYNLTYPSVEVYRENSDEVLASFNNIFGNSFEKYQIFLTNLTDNESYSTFDLRSFGDVGRVNWKIISQDILLKKMRIDEIRKELTSNLINSDNLMLSNDNKMLSEENGN